MNPVSSFEFFRWVTFSKPVEDRMIFKAIRKHRCRSIVEIGLSDGARAEKMIRIAQKYAGTETIRYTGIDMFEGRGDSQPPLMLRQQHQRLIKLGAKVQLVPGRLSNSISRIANSHAETDLIVVSAGHDRDDFDASCFYFPRMMQAESKFLIQHTHGEKFESFPRQQIEQLANQAESSSARAA